MKKTLSGVELEISKTKEYMKSMYLFSYILSIIGGFLIAYYLTAPITTSLSILSVVIGVLLLLSGLELSVRKDIFSLILIRYSIGLIPITESFWERLIALEETSAKTKKMFRLQESHHKDNINLTMFYEMRFELVALIEIECFEPMNKS